MKLREHLKSWLWGLLVTGLLLWSTTLHATVPPSWKDGGFSINASGMSLRGVFDEFSRSHGVRLVMSIEGDRIVKGRLKADNGVEFLNRLSGSYPFRWFVYNDTLYVVPANDNTSARLQVGEDAVQDAKSALVGLGLFDERFGWGELPDEGVVIVSGPRSYVDLAREVLMPNGKKEVRRGRQIMMFRLKYATATDRVINSRGKSETIPGIKTILSNLMFGPHNAEQVTDPSKRFDAGSTKRSRSPKNERGERDDVQDSADNSSFAPLFSAPASGGKNAIMPNGRDRSSRATDREESRQPPRIEADPTLNAIMIYDDISKKETYASLIAELDVKPQQVEIEALIVDIDRSRLSEMGVEWGVRAGAVNSVFNSTTGASAGSDLPLPGATLLISNVARFYARLKAMESNGEARVLATPTVLTLDNVAAVLDLSQSAYVSLIGERVADMSDITAGTKLRVIPRIIRDGAETRVRLEVDIEDGSLNNDNANSGSGSGNGNGGTIATSVTRSSISTQAIIDAQQTLMIGGYRAESLIRKKQKVPLLGDIPLVGGLFRSENSSNSTRERLFLITPRITGSDGVKTAMLNDADKTTAKGSLRGMPAEPVPAPGAPAKSLPAPATDATSSSGARTTPLPLPGATSPAAPAPVMRPAVAPGEAAPASDMPTMTAEAGVTMGSGVHLPLRKVTSKCAKPSGIRFM